jgi:hypothetical protein
MSSCKLHMIFPPLTHTHTHNLLHSTYQNTSQTQLATQYTPEHITNTAYYTVHTRTHHKHSLLHSTHQNTSQTLDHFTRIDIHVHVATCTVTIFTRRMCLKHCFASKCFIAVCESFCHAHPNNEVPNETIIFGLVEKYGEAWNVCCLAHSST